MKKSGKTKAALVKSVFTVGDELFATTFGKGNSSIVEKNIIGQKVSDAKSAVGNFDMQDGDGFKFIVSSKKTKISDAVIDDPRNSIVGMNDVLHAKDKWEKRFYGKTFNDNIHIQVIYNILDIQKILSVHINNVVYEIDNLLGLNENADFIGKLYDRNDYDVFCNPSLNKNLTDDIKTNINQSKKDFDKLMNSHLLELFGSTFVAPKDKDEKAQETFKKKMYYILTTIAGLRHYCVHGRNNTWIYNIRKSTAGVESSVSEEFYNIIDLIYNEKINAINKDFYENNRKVNLPIIYELLNAGTSTEKILINNSFFDFVVRKKYKYLGFSIKLLRELLLKQNQYLAFTSKKYDSVRSKLYTIIDYLIYRFYITQGQNRAEQLVLKLRSTAKDENKKAEIYLDEVKLLVSDLKNNLNRISNIITGANIKNIKEIGRNALIRIESLEKQIEELYGNVVVESQASLRDEKVKEIAIARNFCKIIYILTLFLDGKEINDLLTTLVNKFSNIGSLNNVLKDCKLDSKLSNDYIMFKYANEIAEELQFINSFARMDIKMDSCKNIMLIKAIKILGTNKNEQQINEYVKKMSAPTEFKGQKIKEHGIRNFLINNVVDSRMFKYLIRYAQEDKVKYIAKNKIIVQYVLNRLPEKQIELYCQKCKIKTQNKEDVINELSDIISNMNFEQFEYVQQDCRGNDSPQAKEKEKFQGMIALYLTVIYQAIKNLIYINSRYFMAFYLWERDSYLLGVHDETNYTKLTNDFVDKNYLNTKKHGYIIENLENADNNVIRKYRNMIAHLNIIRRVDKYCNDLSKMNSYFELYHYITQRSLLDEVNEFTSSNLKNYLEKVLKYNTYNKYALKVLNIAFGYNLPRYKNLSIDDLFDKNIERPKKKQIRN